MKQQVEEQRLLNALNFFKNQYNETPIQLTDALNKGKKFKDEGLTPCYIVDVTTSKFFVTSEEMMDKKFH